jgi:hypothetical protein
VFLCGIPRGGSTWIMEVLSTRPQTRMIAEPFNLRVPRIADALGTDDWNECGTEDFRQRALAYLRNLESGHLRFLNPNPLVLWRFYTRRTLYKVIHLPTDLACGMAEELGAVPLVLLRHPVPVALSRKVFPLLDTLDDCPLLESLTTMQREVLFQIRKDGSHLERGLAAWSFHFYPYLSTIDMKQPPDNLLTYEEMLTDAKETLSRVERVLGERFPENVHEHLRRPSRVQSKSDEDTRKVLSAEEGEARTRHLLERWKDQISEEERVRGQEILDIFGIRVYDLGSSQPQITRITTL